MVADFIILSIATLARYSAISGAGAACIVKEQNKRSKVQAAAFDIAYKLATSSDVLAQRETLKNNFRLRIYFFHNSHPPLS